MTDNPAELAYDEMRALGIAYEVMECDPELADTAVFCDHYGVSLADSVNTILVKAKTGGERFAACVLLADSRLDVNRVVRKKLSARRVSFASAQETRDLTGMEIGGVTPFGLPNDMPLWIDARVVARDSVILGGGNRSTKLRVNATDLRLRPNSEVVDGLALATG